MWVGSGERKHRQLAQGKGVLTFSHILILPLWKEDERVKNMVRAREKRAKDQTIWLALILGLVLRSQKKGGRVVFKAQLPRAELGV